MKIKPGDVVRFKKSFGGPAIEDCRTIYFISTRRGVPTYHTGADPVTDLKLKDENIIEIVDHKKIINQKYYEEAYKLKGAIKRYDSMSWKLAPRQKYKVCEDGSMEWGEFIPLTKEQEKKYNNAESKKENAEDRLMIVQNILRY